MLFSSLTFLYLFLPAVLLVYALAPQKCKNGVLLLFSLAFYFYGEPKYTLLILSVALSGYLHGLWIARAKAPGWKKAALVSSIVCGIAALIVFKYADLFLGTLGALSGTNIPLLHLALPIGISFYTFQSVSYTIDVFRGDAEVQKNPARFLLYIAFFPQLIAGPIVRYTDISDALETRRVTPDDLAAGLTRFLCGLGKKVLLANPLGALVAACDASASPDVLGAWLAALGYMLQIYYDFSGYSDMAIGLGRMFGFRFPENFNFPHLAKSVTEFWRRWHMTLSLWFRDYVYIPLGGNRVSTARWLFNILLVWALTGLWHGASWVFAAWGLYFAVLLCAEKLFLLRLLDRLPRAVGHVYTLLAVLLSFVLFRSEGLAAALNACGALFGAGGIPLYHAESVYALSSAAVLLLAGVALATPLLPKLLASIRRNTAGNRVLNILTPIASLLLLAVCTAFLVDGSFNPFLYFRF